MIYEAIEKLISELFSGNFKKVITKDDCDVVLAQDNLWLFTKDIDGEVVAMVTLYVMTLFSRKVGVIEEVVTLQEHRNKGIGSKLVEIAIDKAKKLGCDCVELTVREDRPEVQRFYEKIGFKDRKQRAMRLKLK